MNGYSMSQITVCLLGSVLIREVCCIMSESVVLKKKVKIKNTSTTPDIPQCIVVE